MSDPARPVQTAADSSLHFPPYHSSQDFLVSFQDLSIDSMLLDLPSYAHVIKPSTMGQEVSDIFEGNSQLPGVLVMKGEQFLGVISRETFFERTGKIFGTEVFLVRPIKKMLETISHEPLILPDTTLITLATQTALKRDRSSIYQPVVISNTYKQYSLVSALMLFMAQSHQLMQIHNQRRFTVQSGQDISDREAVIRFIKHAGLSKKFTPSKFLQRHSTRCDHCGEMIHYSIIDIVRAHPNLNQGVIVEQKMGSRSYRFYVRHRCGNEIWEIPVHHDEELSYRSQRPARLVETYA
jgi:hypothetical protein